MTTGLVQENGGNYSPSRQHKQPSAPPWQRERPWSTPNINFMEELKTARRSTVPLENRGFLTSGREFIPP